jgi:hypothetical protein
VAETFHAPDKWVALTEWLAQVDSVLQAWDQVKASL